MESISELRAICQKPKVSDREDIGMSYQDLKSKIELGISIYFTWVFLRFGISANSVTLLSGLAAILGGILLSFNNVWIALLGIIFLEIYNLLDYSDGEIARYNKKGSITGWFLDWYMLFVRDAAMFTGLAISAYLIESSLFVTLCGFLAVLTPFMDKAIIGCGWTVISWQRLVKLQNGKLVGTLDENQNSYNKKEINIEKNDLSEKRLPSKQNSLIFILIKKVWRVSICMFQHHWSLAALTLILFAQIITNYFYPLLDFRLYLVIYCGFYGPFYVLTRLYRTLKDNTFQHKYDLIFHNKDKVKAIDYII